MEQEILNRWEKKKEHIQNLVNNLRALRLNITKDLNSTNEKDKLTALVIAIMDKTGERVGNNNSAENGHYGVTGLKKKHIKLNSNNITLKYVGKSGVEHEKSFSDSKIAKALKEAIKNSKSNNVFETSNGFKISNDRVNRYLSEFNITAKDIRGYSANNWIIKKLEAKDLPKEEKDRKKIFSETLKSIAEKIGHGKGTLKKHYLIPELEINYIENANIINLSNKDSYESGGNINNFEYTIGGL